MSSLNLDPQLSKTRSLRGDSNTDGWLKLDFATQILVRPMSSSATSTSSQSVSCMGRLIPLKSEPESVNLLRRN